MTAQPCCRCGQRDDHSYPWPFMGTSCPKLNPPNCYESYVNIAHEPITRAQPLLLWCAQYSQLQTTTAGCLASNNISPLNCNTQPPLQKPICQKALSKWCQNGVKTEHQLLAPAVSLCSSDNQARHKKIQGTYRNSHILLLDLTKKGAVIVQATQSSTKIALPFLKPYHTPCRTFKHAVSISSSREKHCCHPVTSIL